MKCPIFIVNLFTNLIALKYRDLVLEYKYLVGKYIAGRWFQMRQRICCLIVVRICCMVLLGCGRIYYKLLVGCCGFCAA